MRPLQAHCHMALGAIHSSGGWVENACVHLATGVSLFREMGMGHWLGNAERELAEVPSHGDDGHRADNVPD